MPTSAFYKFEVNSENLAKGIHQLHAAGHTLKVYLSNATPNQATNAVKADLAEITAQYGYPAGGNDIQNDISRAGAVTTVSGIDTTFTAAGGTFGPFRYAVLYNDTPTSPADPLIGYWDYGSSISCGDAESILVDVLTGLMTITTT
jgi:hypothetical protein